MSWLTKILGAGGLNQAEVDANNQLFVRGAINPNLAGLYGISAINDAGTVIGTPRGKRGYITEAGRLMIAPTLILFDDTFNMTAQNTGKWRFAATTQTGALATGLLTLNNSGITTNPSDSAIQTQRSFPLFGSQELRCIITGMIASAFPHVANNTIELGLFTATIPGQAAPTDGVFFRYNAANELRGVVSFNGTEVQTTAIAQPSTGALHDFMIIAQNDVVTFWIDRILVGVVTLTIDAPATGQPFLNGSQPVTIRQRINSGPPASATKFQVSDVFVQQIGLDSTKAWSEILASMGRHAYQGQDGGTMGTTGQYVNNANPAATVPTNTTAALGTGLGGIFQETLTLAAGTDGIISSFQNPAGTLNQTPRNLIITGVAISGVVTVALATSPLTGTLALCFGHTAVSLATGESGSFVSPLTKAPRRIALGTTAILSATAAAGTPVSGTPLVMKFNAPVVIAPGEFIAISHKKISTAPTAGAIMWTITFDGYFE